MQKYLYQSLHRLLGQSGTGEIPDRLQYIVISNGVKGLLADMPTHMSHPATNWIF
jgi:hypothetical protein